MAEWKKFNYNGRELGFHGDDPAAHTLAAYGMPPEKLLSFFHFPQLKGKSLTAELTLWPAWAEDASTCNILLKLDGKNVGSMSISTKMEAGGRVLTIDNTNISQLGRRGFGTTLFSKVLDLAEGSDVKAIRLDARFSGCHLWAKLGFTPSAESWTTLRAQLNRDYGEGFAAANPKAIWDIADKDRERKVLNENREWNGELSMTPGPGLERCKNGIEAAKRKLYEFLATGEEINAQRYRLPIQPNPAPRAGAESASLPWQERSGSPVGAAHRE